MVNNIVEINHFDTTGARNIPDLLIIHVDIGVLTGDRCTVAVVARAIHSLSRRRVVPIVGRGMRFLSRRRVLPIARQSAFYIYIIVNKIC